MPRPTGSITRVVVAAGCRVVDAIGLAPRLDVEALRRAAGLGADDDPTAVEPIEAFLAALHDDLDLTAQGRVLLARRVVKILKTRASLRHRAATEALPALATGGRPIVVTGFPRTGTTLAHRVLAATSEAIAPTWAETMEPVLEGRGPIDRRRRARSRRAAWSVGIVNRLAPGLQSVHELLPDGPEECTVLHEIALDSESFALLGPVRRYRDWLDGRDDRRRRERYDWQSLAMRSILADRPAADRSRRWVLKAPQHLLQVDDLLRIFPEAIVVRMHRDPVDAMASTGSLVAHACRLATRGLPPGHGAELLETFLDWQTRGDEGMSRHADAVIEMRYDDLVADPVRFAERVHDRAGLPLDARHADAIRAHLSARPRHHFGRHRYDLASFGLAESDARTATADYADRIASLPRD